MLLSSWTLVGVRLVPRDMKSWLYIVILYSTEVVRRSQVYVGSTALKTSA